MHTTPHLTKQNIELNSILSIESHSKTKRIVKEESNQNKWIKRTIRSTQTKNDPISQRFQNVRKKQKKKLRNHSKSMDKITFNTIIATQSKSIQSVFVFASRRLLSSFDCLHNFLYTKSTTAAPHNITKYFLPSLKILLMMRGCGWWCG